MKRLLPLLLADLMALVPAGTRAQTLATPSGTNWCGTAAEQQRYFATHPGAREAQQALYERLAVQAQALQQRGALATPDVTIPMMVHVLHAGGPENISDQQINSAIALLNLDYQKPNADTATTFIVLVQRITTGMSPRRG